MNGIRIRWTRQRQEQMEAFLTFDQAREYFGLGGTPDSLVRDRVRRVATQPEIVAAAEKLGDARMLDAKTQQINYMEVTTSHEVPARAPEVCCTCHQPLKAR